MSGEHAKYTQADKCANDYYDVSNEAPELLRKEIFRDPPPSIYEAITRTTHRTSNENHDDFYGITPVETPVPPGDMLTQVSLLPCAVFRPFLCLTNQDQPKQLLGNILIMLRSFPFATHRTLEIGETDT